MAFPQSSFKECVESHENISCHLVSKNCFVLCGATTTVGLPDARHRPNCMDFIYCTEFDGVKILFLQL